MSVTEATNKKTVSNGPRRDFNIIRLLLEGRAFFALIVIIAVFSFLSPYYFSLNNFLIMASHVAIFGILAIGMLLVILNGGIDLSVGSTLASPAASQAS
jgi:erythritol transport system permease protein